MTQTRREALQHLLFGSGALGLKSLVTGVPLAVLIASRHSAAQALTAAQAAPTGRPAQFVIFSTSSSGDPINANVPGTYDDPTIHHSTDPSMAAIPIAFGNATVKGAQIWSTLPASMLAQSCFFHHATYTNIHPAETRVLSLQGAATGGEMLPSVLSKNLASKLGTVRSQPINFNLGGNEAITFGGTLQPALTPSSLASMLSLPGDGLGDSNLVSLRDKSLDALHAWAKARGQDYQRSVIDQYALSQQEVRALQGQLVTALSSIKGNGPAAQMQAAILLFKMKVTPVVVLNLPFGGDNHSDANFTQFEVAQHKASIATLGTLPQLAQEAGLSDQVTYCSLNVFGRTLGNNITNNGRDHNEYHAVSLIIGSNVSGGVIGGVKANGSNHLAQSIDSRSGQASDTGDISFADTFASFGKTSLAAAGIEDSVVNASVRNGSSVTAALKT